MDKKTDGFYEIRQGGNFREFIKPSADVLENLVKTPADYPDRCTRGKGLRVPDIM